MVSVGNLAVGGTGKTPTVEMVARWLTEDGRRVAILSRGYGRRPGGPVELVSDGGEPRLSAERAGDEPLLLARRLPGVAVVVGADRLAAGRWAVSELQPNVVLLDDGFQQRRLLKDLEIVCLDARAPWGPGGLFPRGTLREPPSALARADLVVLTRADGRFEHANDAFVRAFLCALFPIGLFWSAVSSRNESVQDLLVRTTVLYDWGPKLPPMQ